MKKRTIKKYHLKESVKIALMIAFLVVSLFAIGRDYLRKIDGINKGKIKVEYNGER